LRKDAEARIAALEAARTQKATLATLTDTHELARSLQFELKRVGCFNGSVNGEFDDATRAAWHAFVKSASIKTGDDELSSDAIKAVRAFDKRVCPLVCANGERARGDRCVAIAPNREVEPRPRSGSSTSALEESLKVAPRGTFTTGEVKVLTARNGRKMTCVGGSYNPPVERKCTWH
jgi:hypothetical protein